MTIETKFKVNDLVCSKYQKVNELPESPKHNFEQFMGWEVIEIQAVTCSAGTQIFYILRAIHAIKFGDSVSFFPEPDASKVFKLREDEIVIMPEKISSILTQKVV